MSVVTDRKIKLDAVAAAAIDQARVAAEAYAGDFGVGDHVGDGGFLLRGQAVVTHAQREAASVLDECRGERGVVGIGMGGDEGSSHADHYGALAH